MKQVVLNEDYDEPGEFVRAAIENQLEHDERTSTEAKTLEEAFSVVGADSAEVKQDETHSVPEQTSQSKEQLVDDIISINQNHETDLSVTRRQYEALSTVGAPDESRLDEGPLWGQYNRIFPVKLVVRGLANDLLDATGIEDNEEGWIALPSFRRRVAAIAREVGMDIASYDEQIGRTRGEKLAAGLPTGDDAEKSMDRFQTHFVGRVEHGDELTGAPPHLSLVNITNGSPQKIGLTDAGKEFASLHNPILDEGTDADQALSQEERQFYITHIHEIRPDEYAAMQKVAQAITEGDDRPDGLTKRVAYIDPEWSNSQAQTIRSGLTSRMYELGLLDRRRVGQRGIAYELTTEGEAFRTDGTAFATEQRGNDT
jgi:hypothetical protein